MNSINASTGFSGFMLKSGHASQIIPSLVSIDNIPSIVITLPENNTTAPDITTARNLLDQLHVDFLDASDSLTAAKISQAHHANTDRSLDHHFTVSDKVLLATAKCCWKYMQSKDGHVVKFMPQFDGPYTILKAFPESSLYTLVLPENLLIHPSFHSSQLRPFIENDVILFLNRTLPRPGPIVTADGSTEYFIDSIIDEQKWGRGKQYLVRWLGYSPESDLWLPASELVDTAAFETWSA
ncbi:hypothetical protein Hypma_010545 [Hypsizygus marmoreus]|uniref:Chromo domain-containing protein n=1 Tax=Hypsizygus marmoreus TaxID=39966 RepID=A0A369JRP3_HYPMA|nr:hypothetical protein Hypma_010545 [Hypsizygus marmoreus]